MLPRPLVKAALVRLVRLAAEEGGIAAPDLGTIDPAKTDEKETGPKRKLALILDQADDGELELLPGARSGRLRQDFVELYGADPAEDERCTSEQLCALGARLAKDAVPYADFGVWGPSAGASRRPCSSPPRSSSAASS